MLVSLKKELKRDMDIVVMVQGDEPMTEPAMIEEAISLIVRYINFSCKSDG